MRKFAVLLILLLAPLAHADLRCADVFPVDKPSAWRNALNRVFRENLLGKAPEEKELYFYWHTSNPMDLKRVDDHDVAVYSNKRMRIYRNHDDLAAENPLRITNTFGGRRSTPNEEMLKAFIASYKQRITEGVIEAVKEIESILSNISEYRQSFGYVATAPEWLGGKIVGTFRVYNGTWSHSSSMPFLPMEVSFVRDKVRPKILDRLLKLRQENPNALIFEIGKFSIIALSARMADRVRNMLELFLLRYYVDTLPDDALFFVHTLSEAHVRRYESRYGMKVIEEVRIPNQAETEYVMEATAKELRQALRKVHGIPERGVRITLP